jgi:hypothetical protein
MTNTVAATTLSLPRAQVSTAPVSSASIRVIAMTDEVILANPGNFGGAANSVCMMDTAAIGKYLKKSCHQLQQQDVHPHRRRPGTSKPTQQSESTG